ncbi:Bug family tripartite tricarboxylate transporter substrate binding protein [Ramlibacter henchirensis]|uniref:Bug family tripartite tricarboxylate transporter substrate binding protein n=1 Tax=Ramlibacter henchirensis TaxID=204072 RepID=UPI0014317015|nr:tripartite tricarboxylate transporter substrate binding protein [Ramlibacter henchirensis]
MSRLFFCLSRVFRLASGSAVVAVATIATAQTYPSKPVRIINPYTAGSTGDSIARIVADELKASMGGTFLVESKPGAVGQVGSDYVSKSPADGYTLLVSSSATHSIGPWLTKALPYDALKDFTHIARLVMIPYMLVVKAENAPSTAADFVAEARRKGNMSYGYGSSTAQVAAMAFASSARFPALGVPYKGQPAAVNDLIGGQIQFMMADLSVAAPLVRAGKLKALGVTSTTRSALWPDIPTLSEAGFPENDLVAWVGFAGPPKMPKDVVDRLSAEIVKLGQKPEVRQRFAGLGLDFSPNTFSDHVEFTKSQLNAWGSRIKAAGIQPE